MRTTLPRKLSAVSGGELIHSLALSSASSSLVLPDLALADPIIANGAAATVIVIAIAAPPRNRRRVWPGSASLPKLLARLFSRGMYFSPLGIDRFHRVGRAKPLGFVAIRDPFRK